MQQKGVGKQLKENMFVYGVCAWAVGVHNRYNTLIFRLDSIFSDISNSFQPLKTYIENWIIGPDCLLQSKLSRVSHRISSHDFIAQNMLRYRLLLHSRFFPFSLWLMWDGCVVMMWARKCSVYMSSKMWVNVHIPCERVIGSFQGD